MRRLNKIATCVAVALAIASTHQTAFALDLVYSNATTDLGVNFNPGNNSEVGNEVVLAGTSRLVTFFRFQYFDTGGLINDDTADIRFYENNGPMVSGADSPGTLLYDSGAFAIPSTPRQTMILDQSDLDGGILVPTDFTWTVTFSGSDTNGLSLYAPPTVGSNFADEWVNTGSGWVLETAIDPTDPLEFAAVIGATAPDSSSLPVSALGVLICLGGATIAKIKNRRCAAS